MRCLLLLLACVFAASSVEAATYHVAKIPQGGNDANSCATAQTVGTPKLTITSGLTCLSAGDTLLVRVGVYAEGIDDNIPSGTSWANPVRIANYMGESVTLRPGSSTRVVFQIGVTGAVDQYIDWDGIDFDAVNTIDGSVFQDVNSHHIRWQNFEVSDYNGHGYCAIFCLAGDDSELLNIEAHGGGIVGASHPAGNYYCVYLQNDRNVVDGMDCYDVALAGIQIYSGSFGLPDGNIVRNSRFHAIRVTVPGDNRLFCIIEAGQNTQLYNNFCYDITAVPHEGSNAALYAFASIGPKFWNNTVVSTNLYCVYLDAFGSGVVGAEVRNTICRLNTFNSIGGGGTGTTASNNLFGTDPLFVSPGTGDFRLQAGSPAIDAGFPVSISEDYEGDVRPQGGLFDIGADEFSTGVVGDPTWPVSETFTGTNGESLAVHVGESGANWIVHSGATAAQIANGRLRASSTGVAGFSASGVPPSADYCAIADLRQMTEIDGTIGVKIRITAVDTFLIGYYWGGVAERRFHLVRVLGGIVTELGTPFSQILTSGVDTVMRVCGLGATSWLEYAGSVVIGPVPEVILTAGVAGIDFSSNVAQSDTTGYHMSAFSTVTITPTVSPNRFRLRRK